MNGSSLIALGIGALVGVSVMLFFLSLRSLKSEVPTEDREYMDPLPPLLRAPAGKIGDIGSHG